MTAVLRLVSPPSEKRCARCEGTRFDARGACRECAATRARAWRTKNPDRAREADQRKARKRRDDPEFRERENERSRKRRRSDPARKSAEGRLYRRNNPIRALLARIKCSARSIGVAFDLGPEDVVFPNFCPVLGIPITKSDRHAPGYPQIDRFIPELGYVRGNVTVISARANLLKSNGTLEEHEMLVRWMRSRVGSDAHG